MGEDVMSQKEIRDYIENELKVSIKPEDPVTKASDHDDPMDEWMDILGNNQLKKKVIRKGEDGTRPTRGDICVIDLSAKLPGPFLHLVRDGEILETKENFAIQLGDMEVVQGLDLAIALMNVGEIAEIIVDPRFGYGKSGYQHIPPNAVIIYTVELKETAPEPVLERLSLNQRREISFNKRERGNWWFDRDESIIAIQCYRRALKYLGEDYVINMKDSINRNEEDNLVNNSVFQNMLEDCLKVHNNLAAALIKTEAYDAALENVEIVLRHQPENEKALYRKGKALELKGEYTKAYTIFTEIQKLNPRIKSLNMDLINLQNKIAKNAKKEKSLYRKMLGNVDKESTDSSKIQDKSKIAKGLLWTLVGGASAAVIGILIHRFAS